LIIIDFYYTFARIMAGKFPADNTQEQ